MQIDWTKPVETQEPKPRSVRILCTDAGGPFPIARLREGLNVIAGRSWGCGCDCCVKSSDIARAALSHSQAPEPCPKCADSPDATQAREMLAYVLGIEHGGPAAPAPGGE